MTWQSAEAEYTDAVTGTGSVPELIDASMRRHGDGVAQRYKGGVYDRSLTPDPLAVAPTGEFAAVSYGELRTIVQRLAVGFRELGVTHGDRVGIFANTRMEWAQTDLALLAAGGVVTTIYEGSSSDMVEYLLTDSGSIGVVVEGVDTLDRVRSLEPDLELSFIVSMDAVDTSADLVYTLKDVYDLGRDAADSAYEEWIDAISADDLASIIYTSGTTGRPKGVQLTHGNLRANLSQIRKRYGPRPDKPRDLPRIDHTTEAVSFLPLAHVFERTAGHFTMFAAGGSVAYAESPDTLQEDFQTVEPTVATSVPRVYEKIYSAIREQAQSSPIKERIFHWAVGVGQAYHRSPDPGPLLSMKQSIADRLVFGKVKDALGGEIQMLISGGGSLSADLCALYHGMGLPIYEGYGLTETAPVATCNPVERPEIGTIGPPVVDMEVDIDETVERPNSLNETSDGTVGELRLRGPNVSPGYWNNEEATAAAYDDEGWFSTGDIVRERSDGYLEFVERVKELLVLSTGKNVAPGHIEDAFASVELVEQVMAIGDGHKFVGALIVPNFEALEEVAAEIDYDLPDDPDAVCRDEWVHDRIDTVVSSVNEGFETVETIKRFRLVPVQFTEENDLLTPSMKKKRRNILDRFADQVDEIYAEE